MVTAMTGGMADATPSPPSSRTASPRSSWRSRARCSASTASELADPWYRFMVCAVEPAGAHVGRLHDRHAVRARRPRRGRHRHRARVVPHDDEPPAPELIDALRAAHGAAPGSVGLLAARSPRRRRPARRPPGDDALDARRASWPGATRRSTSTPSALRRRGRRSSRRPAPPPASTSACTSCASTTAPRWPTPSPAAWSCRPTATAARPSSSTSPCRRRAGDDPLGRRRSTGCSSTSTSRSSVEDLARRAAMSPRTFARRFRAVDRHDAAAVAAAPAGRCSPSGCSRRPTSPSSSSPTAAASVTARRPAPRTSSGSRRHLPAGLPPHVPLPAAPASRPPEVA